MWAASGAGHDHDRLYGGERQVVGAADDRLDLIS